MANIDKIKVGSTTYDIVDATAIHSLEGYATTNDVTAATSALATEIANQHYQTSGDVQNAISGKADTTALTVYADAVKYNTSSKYVEFYHGGTGGTVVFSYDASPFLIDGMVESVVITSVTSGGSQVQVLEITWNSAAGGQVTDIPLSEIFNSSDYYTTAQTQSYVSGYTYDKTTIDNKIGQGGTFDPSLYYQKTQTSGSTELSTAFSAKQDTLTVSGTTLVIS